MFTILSNEFHQFGFGGGVKVVVVGDEEDIGSGLYVVVQLSGLDEFFDVDFGGELAISQLSFQLVVSFVEIVLG